MLIYYWLEWWHRKGSGQATTAKETRRTNYRKRLLQWMCLSRDRTWGNLSVVVKNVAGYRTCIKAFPSLCGPVVGNVLE